MKRRDWLSVVATCALFAAPLRAQDPASPADPAVADQEKPTEQEEAKGEPSGVRRGQPLEEGERERLVGELLDAYPTWVSRVTLGGETSADGEDRGVPHALVLTHHAELGVVPQNRSALLFAGGGLGHHGDELSLTLAWKLAEEAKAGGDAGRLLKNCTIYLGLGFEHGLDTDFPAGWRPPRMGGAGATSPLSRPDSRALVRFLTAHREVVSVVRLRRAGMKGDLAWRGSFAPNQDRTAGAAYLRGGEAPSAEVSLWPEAGRGGGSLLDWAYQARGLFVWAVHEPALEAGEELGAWVDLAGERLVAAAAALPRVNFGTPEVSSIGTNLWCVEVPVINDGRLPTSSLLAERNGMRTPLHLRVRGLRVVAFAFSRGSRTSGLTFESGALVDMSDVRQARGLEAVLPDRLEARGTFFVRLVLAPQAATGEMESTAGGVNGSSGAAKEAAASEAGEPGQVSPPSPGDDSAEQTVPVLEIVTPEGVLDSLELDAVR